MSRWNSLYEHVKVLTSGGRVRPATIVARTDADHVTVRIGHGTPFAAVVEIVNGKRRLKEGSGTVTVTGGTITTVGSYTVHTFTANGTLAVTGGSKTVDYFILGGGGGGGSANFAGGGAGQATAYTSQSLAAGSYAITIGGGGAVDTNGTATTLGAVRTGTAGLAGASGAGGASGNGFAGGASDHSFPVDTGGGGGGATAAGSGANGGASIVNAYRLASEVFAGGGGGYIYDIEFDTPVGYGVHGGGNSANHGGGGNGNGFAGNSGILIVRYLT